LSGPGSIWKGNDPKPEDDVENCEAVDKPRVRRLGGAGRGSLSDSWFGVLSLKVCAGSGEGGATFIICSANGDDGGPPLLNDCCPRGDTGGDLAGLSEIGDGGTNGKDSRIESARVDVADIAEELDILLFGSNP